MEKDEYRVMKEIEEAYWWFAGKGLLVSSVLHRLCGNRVRGNRILDIGSGTGFVLEILSSYGTVCGVELSPEAIRFLREKDGGLLVRSDVSRDLPFRNNTFSAVTCLDVLEHLDNDAGLLKEIFRVCQPLGCVIITVPAMQLLWSSHDIALHHKRRYTRKKILKKAGAVGFTVMKASYYNTILFPLVFAVRKLKSFFSYERPIRSDFFLPIPKWINAMLSLLFAYEIRLLQRLSFPVGVSLLVILQKQGLNELQGQ